jgi:hypothetical protein
MNRKLTFIKACYYAGVAADFLATVPLLSPEIAKMMFGLAGLKATGDFLYVSRAGASLMLGWTALLLWASLKPVERRGILLLTAFPVLTGLAIASILAVMSGAIEAGYMIPLWVFYLVYTPSCLLGYKFAGQLEAEAKNV